MINLLILLFLLVGCSGTKEIQKPFRPSPGEWAKIDVLYEMDLLHEADDESRITLVQAKYGTPDIIKDSSGSMSRIYTADDRPIYEWPAYAPRTFYYFKLNKQFKFIYGRLVGTGKIPNHMWEWTKDMRVKSNEREE